MSALRQRADVYRELGILNLAYNDLDEYLSHNTSFDPKLKRVNFLIAKDEKK